MSRRPTTRAERAGGIRDATVYYGAAKRGTELPQAKLDAGIVREIRERHAAKERLKRMLDEAHSHEALAADYGVSTSAIGKVLAYDTWRHVL